MISGPERLVRCSANQSPTRSAMRHLLSFCEDPSCKLQGTDLSGSADAEAIAASAYKERNRCARRLLMADQGTERPGRNEVVLRSNDGQHRAPDREPRHIAGIIVGKKTLHLRRVLRSGLEAIEAPHAAHSALRRPRQLRMLRKAREACQMRGSDRHP